MKGISHILFCVALVSILPLVADAAGTYYNGNLYQNPQRYGTMAGGNGGGFYNNYGAGRGYGQNMQNMGVTKTTVQTVKKTTKKTSTDKKQGLQMGVGLSHEFADWGFDMNDAGSKLHYDNLRWNVIDGEIAYYFGGSTPVQIKVGGRYGMQFGDSPMFDDDISSEYMWETETQIVNGESEDILIGMPALSVGTSKDGTQYGFNASFGLTDLFEVGRAKLTPSLGYRYFKHKLETKNNYGLMVQVLNSETFINCLATENGEIQCGPYIGFANNSGVVTGYGRLSPVVEDGVLVGYIMENDASAAQLDIGNTYYYEQPGTSHSYETEWAGPYIALDMEYAINNDNIVSAGLEFGLPIYDSKGNQPYRFDWAHPTSVEDKGEFGDAIHVGFNAMWSTSLSDKVMLNLGMTYDYYRVKDADAKTYLNRDYYTGLYNEGIISAEDYSYLNSIGWTQEAKDEINSVYKSMGIRLGLSAKF